MITELTVSNCLCTAF